MREGLHESKHFLQIAITINDIMMHIIMLHKFTCLILTDARFYWIQVFCMFDVQNICTGIDSIDFIRKLMWM